MSRRARLAAAIAAATAASWAVAATWAYYAIHDGDLRAVTCLALGAAVGRCAALAWEAYK